MLKFKIKLLMDKIYYIWLLRKEICKVLYILVTLLILINEMLIYQLL